MSLKIGKMWQASQLNEYFINIAEYTVDRQIATLASKDIEISILEIKNRRENHMSIENFKHTKLNSTVAFEKTAPSNIRQLIFELNARKPIMGIRIPFQREQEAPRSMGRHSVWVIRKR